MRANRKIRFEEELRQSQYQIQLLSNYWIFASHPHCGSKGVLFVSCTENINKTLLTWSLSRYIYSVSTSSFFTDRSCRGDSSGVICDSFCSCEDICSGDNSGSSNKSSSVCGCSSSRRGEVIWWVSSGGSIKVKVVEWYLEDIGVLPVFKETTKKGSSKDIDKCNRRLVDCQRQTWISWYEAKYTQTLLAWINNDYLRLT